MAEAREVRVVSVPRIDERLVKRMALLSDLYMLDIAVGGETDA